MFAKGHARIQEFSSKGVQVSLTKKSSDVFFFFSPQLILQKSNGQFQRNLSFSRFQRGSNISQGGGSNFFQGGWGSNCLFPIETHITCDFPGGSGPPVPPSGFALEGYWQTTKLSTGMQRVITGKYFSVQYIVSYRDIHAYVYHKYSDTLNTFNMLCPLNKAKVIFKGSS